MSTEQTTEEMSARYEDALTLIRDGGIPTTKELLWFADTSMSFATTLGALFKDFARVQEYAGKLINAVVQHVEPDGVDPAVTEAVIGLAIVIGALTEEDIMPAEGKETLQ